MNEFYEDDLYSKRYLGEVVDVNDPEFEGKIKVKIWGKTDELDIEVLPWAIPSTLNISSSNSGSSFLSVPKLGSIVEVFFDNGDFYSQKWSHCLKISNEVKTRFNTQELYANAQVLYFDVENNYYVYYINTSNADSGFFLRVGADSNSSSQIRIKEDNSILIQSSNNSKIEIDSDGNILLKHNSGKVIHIKSNSISLGSENESQFHAVLFEKLQEWQNQLITQLSLQTPVHPIVGPCLPLAASPTWTNVESLRSQMETFKSLLVTLNR